MKEQLALFGSFLADYGRKLDASKGDPYPEVSVGSELWISGINVWNLKKIHLYLQGPFSPWSAMSPFSFLRAPPSEQLPTALIVDDDNKMLSKVANR